MPITKETTTVLQQNLDDTITQGLTSSWMEVNQKDVIYSGGDEVKIPNVKMSGLGDYDRNSNNAFPDANVDMKYQTVRMTQDRGTRITVDSMDLDESAGILEVSKLMGKFQREKVIPEIDAYRYSTIAQHCILNNQASGGYTADPATLLTKLYTDIAEVQDIVGEDVPLVVTMNMKVAALFDLSKELGKKLETTEFTLGNVSMKVRALDGQIPIIRVGSGRMKSKYVFYDGRTSSDGDASNPTPDQTVGGFMPAADAKDINWLITAATAPIAITKQDKVRLWTPDTYLPSDSYAGDYRRYHDLWIKNTALNLIFANFKQSL